MREIDLISAMVLKHESIDDPQLVAAANVFVDDIIETAKVEAAQRTKVIYYKLFE